MTTKIETLTDEERCVLTNAEEDAVWHVGCQALRIIDAHAAERAALTEQVAQLTEVVDFLRRQNKADHDALSALRRSAEGKVLRLTEQVAAAERSVDMSDAGRDAAFDLIVEAHNERDAAFDALEIAEREVARLTESLEAKGDRWLGRPGLPEREVLARSVAEYADIIVDLESRAESAERDRDAANALLRRIYDWQGPHGFTVTVMNDIKAHLSGQPAALPCVSGYVGAEGQCNDCGKHHAAPAPAEEVFEVQGRSWPAGTHPAPTVAEARDEGQDFDLQAGGLGLSPEDVRRLYPQAAPNAADARVRELETHNASLRERNTELVHLKQVAEARVRELEAFGESTLRLLTRAEAAEHGLNAANVLLRKVHEYGLVLARFNQGGSRLAVDLDNYLSSQHAASAPTAAEAELAALRERVADARRKLTCPNRSAPTRVRDALEALRGI